MWAPVLLFLDHKKRKSQDNKYEVTDKFSLKSKFLQLFENGISRLDKSSGLGKNYVKI